MDLRIFTGTVAPDSNGAATLSFTPAFEDNPIISAIAMGTDADSNVFVSALSKTSVTFQISRDVVDESDDITIHVTAISSTAMRRPSFTPSLIQTPA